MVVSTTISCYSFPRPNLRETSPVKLALLVLFASVVWAHGCSGFIGRTAAGKTAVDPEYPTLEVMLPAHVNAQNP